ncbi:Protein kinase domain containing protein [Spraguea lophii 42_110]|uniref:Protein kinase domain containing protein n=1 Tax=Spraguea lophii (strain 42_110) TaxID=1358809 RepID=S7XUD4_SPRLO|nr:Protein kinase domain containing protein [Spraguea lophii 42_110]
MVSFLNFWKEFDFVQKIGKGASGFVYLIKNKRTMNLYAIKEVKAYKEEYTKGSVNEKLPTYINHQNVLKYYNLFISHRPNFLKKDNEMLISYSKNKTLKSKKSLIYESGFTPVQSLKDNCNISSSNASYKINECILETDDEESYYSYLLSDFCPFTLRDFIDTRNIQYFIMKNKINEKNENVKNQKCESSENENFDKFTDSTSEVKNNKDWLDFYLTKSFNSKISLFNSQGSNKEDDLENFDFYFEKNSQMFDDDELIDRNANHMPTGETVINCQSKPLSSENQFIAEEKLSTFKLQDEFFKFEELIPNRKKESFIGESSDDIFSENYRPIELTNDYKTEIIKNKDYKEFSFDIPVNQGSDFCLNPHEEVFSIKDIFGYKKNVHKNFVLKSFKEEGKNLLINRKFVATIIYQVVKGLTYLHSKNINHNDVKARNIFFQLRGDFVAKIGDFGLYTKCNDTFECARKIRYSNDSHCCVKSILKERKIYNDNCGAEDVLNCGILYFELLYPFRTHMEREKVLEEIKNTRKLPITFCKEYKEETYIIEKCIKKENTKVFKLFDILILLYKLKK